jgi:hypothetical protein
MDIKNQVNDRNWKKNLIGIIFQILGEKSKFY